MNKIKALLLSSVGFAAAVTAGPVCAAAAAADQPAANTVQEVVVLGTRRTDRTLENSASPVDVIGGAELKSQPAANLLDSLKSIVPSFYVGQNSISDASTFVRAPSLRGLPGDEILVMLNGKRYNRSALVQVYGGGDTALSFGSQGADISAIPSIGLKSLQVLRDGATAQYGSDAIAGVLNYGLRDNASGMEVVARYGQYFDNSDGASKQVAANLGFALGEKGFINVSGEYNDDEQTSRGAQRPVAVQFAAANPTLAGKLPNSPDPVQIWGNSPSHGYKLLLNSAYDITPDSKIYLFANYAKIKYNESFNYRSPITGSAVDANGVTHSLGANGAFKNTFYLTPCPTGVATCPTGGFVKDTNTFLFTSIYPAGFTPRFVGETQEAYVTAGYKGKFKSGLTYDISGSISENSLDLSMYSSISPSYGEKSQTSFKFGKLTQKETDFNIDLSYPVNVNGLFGPVVLSGGAVTFFTNAFDTQTRGLDIVATHKVNDVIGGRLNLTLAYNYNTSEVTKRDPAVITDDQVIDIKHLAPNHRVVLTANWSRGPWTVNARENYYGTWKDENDYPGQKFGAKSTTDIDVSYALAERYTITLGATNIFNTYPDKIAQSSSNNVYPVTGSLDNGSVYPRNGGPFGFNGGFWYVRLQGKF